MPIRQVLENTYCSVVTLRLHKVLAHQVNHGLALRALSVMRRVEFQPHFVIGTVR